MIPLALALVAGIGAYLVASTFVPGWRGGSGRRHQGASLRLRAREWLVQAGLGGVRPVEFAAVMLLLLVAAAGAAFALFGGLLPSLLIGIVAAAAPATAFRARRRARLEGAQDAWPRLIEEIRVRATTLGRSLPQALFDVGQRAPTELRPAFDAAHREWLLTVDFARTLDVLKEQLADPTADATCETLLVAHEVGGSDVGPRLAALAADRLADTAARKEARARQAGVRLARRFVLIVPAGMALAGSLIGNGRAAYATPLGQVAVVVALVLVAACWLWAGRYLRLPDGERVFRGRAGSGPEEPTEVGGAATAPRAGEQPMEAR